ncbi:SpoIID/LytB domain-containing protein [Brevibacillus ginsengisoli]|uniref:SpoIID/LytB domain-containing protein n=1 Tax=Brevibacillus ginsengisoli TaxID=363854 RepID=UPI003CED5D06
MKKRRLGRQLLAIASVLSLSLTGYYPTADAAEKNIRVALFVDTGQGYRGVVPSITLASDSGLDVRASDKQSDVSVGINSDQARFRVDEFTVVAVETADLNEAQRTAQQLSKQKLDASITVNSRNGRPIYQVMSGSYNTYDTALSQSKSIAQKVGKQPQIQGPYRVEAGRYKSLADAKKSESTYEASGVPAHTVMLLDGDKAAYAVWLGDEISSSKLNSITAAAEDVKAGRYQKADASSYIVINDEVVAGGNEAETVPQYVFSSQVKLTVKSKGKGTPLITVEEREHRKYRGQIELSDYKNNLTVVNELPMEQYLYGVVGSEMSTGWPLEALKAQAVLARTRAVGQGNKYGVANLSDTVYEQAYYGYSKEAADIRKAVDETAGEVIHYKGKVAESLFYSNAGGMTADGTEVWGTKVPYLAVVDTPDIDPMEKAIPWYHVALADGTIGYVRSDFVTLRSERNPVGLQQGVTKIDKVNFRIGPSSTYHKAITALPIGTELTILQSEPEENAYQWTRGPYTAQELTAMINTSQARNKGAQYNQPIQSLEVTKRGPSGRVMAMEADGMAIAVSNPDGFRSVFSQGGNSLRSTKFDIEQMGQVMVLGANNQTANFPAYDIQAMGADGTSPANGNSDQYVITNGIQAPRIASKQAMFVIHGNGFGHGLGVSQFGAKALAEQGYDYQQILQHYYQDVTIEP